MDKGLHINFDVTFDYEWSSEEDEGLERSLNTSAQIGDHP